jgi:hypothetical protein
VLYLFLANSLSVIQLFFIKVFNSFSFIVFSSFLSSVQPVLAIILNGAGFEGDTISRILFNTKSCSRELSAASIEFTSEFNLL